MVLIQKLGMGKGMKRSATVEHPCIVETKPKVRKSKFTVRIACGGATTRRVGRSTRSHGRATWDSRASYISAVYLKKQTVLQG